MTDPEALIEQLRQSNRRWKALALAACAALILAALLGFIATYRQRRQAEVAMRQMNQTLARANQALTKAYSEAPNPVQPR
jgi:hypothetical protein